MGGGGLNSAKDGTCALNCSRTGIENREGVPYTFSVFFSFGLFQAGTRFLRPDEFLRPRFAIVILADCLSAFDSLKKNPNWLCLLYILPSPFPSTETTF